MRKILILFLIATSLGFSANYKVEVKPNVKIQKMELEQNNLEIENYEQVAESQSKLKEWKDKCYQALTDDFNSPILISYLFEAVKWIFQLKEGDGKISAGELEELKTTLNALVFDVLGLESIEENGGSDKLDEAMRVLIDLRNQARKAKNFELSDQIRDRLLEQGIELKDGKEGTTYTLK